MKMHWRELLLSISLGVWKVFAADAAESAQGNLEVVARFHDAMPTGVSVSQTGRIFVNYPRWGDAVRFTVAELKNGQAVAYPSEQINQLDTNRPTECFISVQSVVVDPKDRLWVLDTGSIKMEPVVPRGPKLVCIDLNSSQVVKSIEFPTNVVLRTSYLNDVRFDLRRGSEGVAFITDSTDKGPNGLVVVDLATGKSRRLLHDNLSTKAERNFMATVEGKPLMQHKPGQPPQPLRTGADGIAISADGTRLYYCPLASHELFSVLTQALLDENLSPEQVAGTIRDEGRKAASDGLESDAEGRIYATDYEHNAIMRRGRDGAWEQLVSDPRALWPDTMALATDGHLYFTANQLHRQPSFHDGKDLRVKPYYLFRFRVDAKPVLLK